MLNKILKWYILQNAYYFSCVIISSMLILESHLSSLHIKQSVEIIIIIVF